MKLKRIIVLFIFSLLLIKPTLAVVKNKKTPTPSLKKAKIGHKHKNYMHGVASFYGKGDAFDGREMANGEVFHANNMFVAAHPTLPLGTKLKVINNYNGKIAYVEVKDRMPIGGRIIDLSYAAARHLGMVHRGLSRVTLVRIDNSEFYRHKHLLENQNSLS
jgi:rare lipoprotein A